MAEPTSTTTGVGLLGLLTVIAGPLAGPYVYVLFGAVLGAFTALAAQPSVSLLRDSLFLLRVACTAMLFTAPLSLIITHYVQLPFEFVTGIAAYLIGWKWDAISGMAWAALKNKPNGGKV